MSNRHENNTAAVLKRWIDWIPFSELGALCVLTTVIGLLFSRAMISIGMIGIVVAAIMTLQVKVFRQKILNNVPAMLLAGVFILYLVSGLYSNDQDYFWDRMMIKLPFLLVPFAYIVIPRWKTKYIHWIFAFLILQMTVISILLTVEYITEFEVINATYKAGQIIPTPIPHIRYSLLCVIALFASLHFFRERITVFWAWEKWLFLGCAIFLAGFLHLLAVRSGLLAFYIILIFEGVRILKRHQGWIRPVLVAVIVPTLFILLYKYVPTITHRIDYTKYSLDLFENKQGYKELSDSRRIASILAGFDIVSRSFISGVGVGDISRESNRYYKRNYPAFGDLNLLPHNQFLFVFASVGFLGFLYFSVAVVSPLMYKAASENLLLAAIHLTLLSSFLVEHTLETQIGTAVYLTFCMLGIKFLDLRTEENA